MTEAEAVRTEAPGGADSRRWLAIVAVGLLVAIVCAGLGRWQWTRHEAKTHRAAVIEANYDAPVVPLVDVLPAPSSALDRDAEWRPVTVTGRYVDGGTVALRNRPVEGTPAVHVLAPMVVETTAGPAVLVVDRGWVPAEEADADGVPGAPTGDVEAVVRLRPLEPAGREGPPGQTYRIDPDGVLAAGHVDDDVRALPALGAYGVLAEESPPTTDAPLPLPRPDTGLGPHLSYAFQWWVFALGAVVGAVVLVRRERATIGTPAPSATAGSGANADGAPPIATPPRRRRRRSSAEAEEDALIDAQIEASRQRPETSDRGTGAGG